MCCARCYGYNQNQALDKHTNKTRTVKCPNHLFRPRTPSTKLGTLKQPGKFHTTTAVSEHLHRMLHRCAIDMCALGMYSALAVRVSKFGVCACVCVCCVCVFVTQPLFFTRFPPRKSNKEGLRGLLFVGYDGRSCFNTPNPTSSN